MDMSQQEVGDRLGISQMHVSRLQQKALERLKRLMRQSEER
jgi:RNA polymerase sigma-B factor